MVREGGLLSAGEAARQVLEARGRGEDVVSALLLTGPAAGGRILVLAAPGKSARVLGRLPDSGLEAAIREEAERWIRGEQAGAGHRRRARREAGTVELPSASPGDVTRVFLEVVRPPPGLLIVGAGHLAVPVHELGALLGFRVTVVDDRPAFARPERFPRADAVLRVDFAAPFREIPLQDRSHVLLVTRGHRYDFECLRLLLGETPLPAYVGMIGSRRRIRAAFHQLLEEGVDRALLRRIRAPVGLEVGAETPEEIAVAVAAEWILLRRGGSGRPLAEVERILDRFFEGRTESSP
jgi:xanthine/CO dehydrogenase XdhC/CoxF family maturation factor